MFETFDHTADLGLRIRAADLDLLFIESARALYSILLDNASAVRPNERAEIAIPGTDREYLLFDWLKALLYRYEADLMVFSRFEVAVNAEGLTASIWGEPVDRDRHMPCREVKAITYHGLKVEQSADGWLAEVIVDI